jgi:hypothetical protein
LGFDVFPLSGGQSGAGVMDGVIADPRDDKNGDGEFRKKPRRQEGEADQLKGRLMGSSLAIHPLPRYLLSRGGSEE